MPDMTGTILARKMLKVRKEMPIILCTGYSETVSPEKAKKAGISTFAMKLILPHARGHTERLGIITKPGGVHVRNTEEV